MTEGCGVASFSRRRSHLLKTQERRDMTDDLGMYFLTIGTLGIVADRVILLGLQQCRAFRFAKAEEGEVDGWFDHGILDLLQTVF